MTEMNYFTEADVRVWAEAHAGLGHPPAVWVLKLLAQRNQLRAVCERWEALAEELAAIAELVAGRSGELTDLALALAERVYLQSELLSRRAEK